jgi:hypothetical protein
MPFDTLTGWKRQFWRWLLLVIMVMQLGGLVFNYYTMKALPLAESTKESLLQHYKDADAYHQSRENVQDARAKVAIMMINAFAAGRKFTDQERQEISQLWQAAEFDKIQAKFLDE